MSEWQPIETAPKDETEEVLIVHRGDVYIAMYDEEHKNWYTHLDFGTDEATYWMPLPAPPEE